MNLAEIRKKALRGETNRGAAGEDSSAPSPAAWQTPDIAPDPYLPEGVAPQSAPPDVTAPGFPAPEFEAPEFEVAQFQVAVAPQEPPAAVRPGTAGAEHDQDDCEDDCEEEQEEFDPAAVILKGRESAAFNQEGAQQDEVAAASVELLCFRVASEEYAISIMDIKEIIKPREVTEVPRVPSFVRGILSLRGNIIPIFDMRVRLGLTGGTPSERERVVVVKRQSGFAGVLVDEVVQVVRIAQGGIEPPPVVLEGIDREFVLGIGRVSGRMLILLDMEKVLDVALL